MDTNIELINNRQCRTCLENIGDKYVSLNENLLGLKTDEDLLVAACLLELGIYINTDDDNILPENICTKCIESLKNAYMFIQQAKRINQQLQKAVRKEKPSSNENALIDVNAHLDCLLEAPIDLPETYNRDLKIKKEANCENIFSDPPVLNEAMETELITDTNVIYSQETDNREIFHLFKQDNQESTDELSYAGRDDLNKFPKTLVNKSWIKNEHERNNHEVSYDGTADKRNMDIKNYIEKITNEMQTLHLELSDIKLLLLQQNEKLAGVNNELHSLCKACKGVLPPISDYYLRFPIQTQTDLLSLEEDINEQNTEEIVAIVRKILNPGGLVKNMQNIFSIGIILDHNVDGIMNKKRLQNYPKLLDILFKAAYQEGWSYHQFLNELRKSIKCAKNRHFKSVCLKKQKQKLKVKNLIVPETIENDDIST